METQPEQSEKKDEQWGIMNKLKSDEVNEIQWIDEMYGGEFRDCFQSISKQNPDSSFQARYHLALADEQNRRAMADLEFVNATFNSEDMYIDEDEGASEGVGKGYVEVSTDSDLSDLAKEIYCDLASSHRHLHADIRREMAVEIERRLTILKRDLIDRLSKV